jgi:superfamily II DNA helicase RecQ
MAGAMTVESGKSNIGPPEEHASPNPGEIASAGSTASATKLPPAGPELLDKLQDVFGFRAFRGVQRQVVDRVLAGHSTLAVMPTGAGKSLTFQLPATMLDGICIVISPLIALMHDQLRSASANGIRAATLTSADENGAETIDAAACRPARSALCRAGTGKPVLISVTCCRSARYRPVRDR